MKMDNKTRHKKARKDMNTHTHTRQFKLCCFGSFSALKISYHLSPLISQQAKKTLELLFISTKDICRTLQLCVTKAFSSSTYSIIFSSFHFVSSFQDPSSSDFSMIASQT